jgi:aminoglycoside phosphotransferase (APT) family kinase protein
VTIPTNPDDLQDQLQQLLRATLGSKVELVNCEIGNQHHDYLVLLANLHHPTTEVVIKLAGPEAPISCPFDRTAALHQLVRENTTIFMPEVLAVDVSCQQWPWRYFIKRYVPGQEWATVHSQLNSSELTEAYAQIGNVVAQLHTINFPSFGELTERGRVEEEQSYLSALVKRADQMIKHIRLYEIFLSVLDKYKSLFTDIGSATLCHEDLHRHNLLFQRQGGKWRLTTILDFDKAWAGFHETDLARLDLWQDMMGEGFWPAYEAIRSIDQLYSQRRAIYQLLWCFEYARSTPEHVTDTQKVWAELGIVGSTLDHVQAGPLGPLFRFL